MTRRERLGLLLSMVVAMAGSVGCTLPFMAAPTPVPRPVPPAAFQVAPTVSGGSGGGAWSGLGAMGTLGASKLPVPSALPTPPPSIAPGTPYDTPVPVYVGAPGSFLDGIPVRDV